MIALDTNILVRYLTQDDEQQWQEAIALIKQNQPCFITNIVICELVWVLRGGNYNFNKDEIINTLEAMLHSSAFQFESRVHAATSLQLVSMERWV